MSLTLEIDFTGTTAAGGGLDTLGPGLHTAQIDSFRHFTDNGSVLYTYMITDGLRHRERFSLPGGKSFLKAFLMSAGVPDNKLSGKSAVPFDKLIGRTVYFKYTPPQLNEEGQRLPGSYPKYSFYTKARYERMASFENQTPAPAPDNGSGGPVMPSDTKKSKGEFDFLLDA